MSASQMRTEVVQKLQGKVIEILEEPEPEAGHQFFPNSDWLSVFV